MVNSRLFCLALLSPFMAASPIPFSGFTAETLIDCTNFALAWKLKESAIPFSCLQSSAYDTHAEVAIKEITASLNNLEGSSLKATEPQISLILPNPVRNEEIDLVTTDCIDPEWCGFQVQKIGQHDCPKNHVFVSRIGTCVPIISAASERTEEFFNPNEEILNENHCGDGLVFNLEKGICELDKKTFSVNSPIKDATSIKSSNFGLNPSDCDEKSIFSPEVGICMPLEGALAKQVAEPVGVDTEFPSSKNCPEGTIFNPEVGICLVFNDNSEEDSQEPPQDHDVISDVTSVAESSPPILTIWPQTKKCGKRTIFDSKTGKCLSVPKSQSYKPIQPFRYIYNFFRPTTTPTPIRLTLAPLTQEQVGRRKCKKGEVYVSEIDLCLDPLKQKNPPL